MDRAWWVNAIQWSLWGVVMTAVMGWLGRSRLKPRIETEDHRLVQPLGTLVIGVVVFGFFAALAIVSNVYSNETTTWWTTTTFLAFSLLGVVIFTAYFIDRHEVSEGGLNFTTIFGVRKSMRWEDVKSLRYALVMKQFHIESNAGEVARISVMLMGLPEFARVALARVPPGAIETSSLEILRATADGRPPSVWN